MTERLRPIERSLRLQLLLVCLLLTGCLPAGTEAFTTPAGIYYLTENPSQEVIEHEECHDERAQREGLKFWLEYLGSAEARCAEELRCNAKNHPYCEDLP